MIRSASRMLSIAALLSFVLGAGSARAGVVDVTDATAEKYFQPGDVIFKRILSAPTAPQRAIIAAQKVIQATAGHHSAAIQKGDASAVHAMLYVGGGQVAEASGKAKKVLLRELSHQYLAGQQNVLEVYRIKDAGLRARIAEVARRWATPARMAYALPVAAILDASFGSRAKQEALSFAKAFATAGGPKGYAQMYCNQFVTAAMQSAALAPGLAKGKASMDAVPVAARVHASHATPMFALGQLRLGVDKHEVEVVGTFRILEQ